MNVQVPGQHEESLFWFAAIVAFMAVASLCMCCYFRRQGATAASVARTLDSAAAGWF